MTFYVFDRWGRQVATLDDVVSAVHTDELNGEDSLTLTLIGDVLAKGMRIVWRDKFGTWHEHVVSELTVEHGIDGVSTTAYCENSIAELLTDYIVEREPTGSAAAVLGRALESTRWSVGTVEVSGTNHTSWYHVSAYEALKDVVEVFGGELSTTIEVAGSEVVGRRVSLLGRRGDDLGQLFTFGRNLERVQREISSDDVLTALYGYGKSLDSYDEEGNATGGHTRKLTFGSANGGVDWVGDDEARDKWGLPDGKGGKKHTFGKVEFDECEDAAELLRLTREELKRTSKPTVSYTGDVVSLAEGGLANGEDTRTGDTVHIRDRDLDERLEGRALKVERDLLDESRTTVTLGNLAPTLSGQQGDIAGNLDWLRERAGGLDGAANLTDSWLSALIAGWNDRINATGGYVYWEQGDGITVYDRPLDQNPTRAIQLKGGSFRIANGRKSNGDWDWRTFGTGDGFTADVVNAGTIKGGSSYWNLETGQIRISDGDIEIDSPTRGTVTRVSPESGFSVSDRTDGDKAITFGIDGEGYPAIQASPDCGSLGIRSDHDLYLSATEGIINVYGLGVHFWSPVHFHQGYSNN